MKHWNRWISFAAIFVFVITACFMSFSYARQAPLSAGPSSISPFFLFVSPPVPNDGSSYSLQRHKQQALISAPMRMSDSSQVALNANDAPKALALSLPLFFLPFFLPFVQGQ
ncbi:hypothetical protein ACHHV8_11995 [Paenibacillus sp. TAB 01]|uniref:hypothetical protein n=1 Tax=Paenibacillus sp. TAB 01 TaxID=3368988 RepID=UPI00375212C8